METGLRPYVRERKHRLPPEFYRGAVSVVYTACSKWPGTPFVDRTVAQTIVEDLGEAASHFECHASIYCLMPDHLHTILTGVNASSDTLASMKRFKQRNSFHLKKIAPQLDWQKDFYDHIVGHSESLSHHVLYIAANPVRWGLVVDWRDYELTGSMGCSLDDVVMVASHVQDSKRVRGAG